MCSLSIALYQTFACISFCMHLVVYLTWWLDIKNYVSGVPMKFFFTCMTLFDTKAKKFYNFLIVFSLIFYRFRNTNASSSVHRNVALYVVASVAHSHFTMPRYYFHEYICCRSEANDVDRTFVGILHICNISLM